MSPKFKAKTTVKSLVWKRVVRADLNRLPARRADARRRWHVGTKPHHRIFEIVERCNCPTFEAADKCKQSDPVVRVDSVKYCQALLVSEADLAKRIYE